MKLTWLGHSGFRLEIGGRILLIDPWLDDNPVFPDERRDEAIADADAIFLTHGHFDHAADAPSIAARTGAPIHAIPELTQALDVPEGVEVTGFNKGGTIALGEVRVTMVNATHSSSIGTDRGPIYTGDPAGFVIRGEGRTIYLSGDTDVMADMGVIAGRFAPDIGILCAGGHFTMDMEGAAYAARTFFDFRTVIPCHYATFPLLEQSARPLVEALPGIDVRTPEVMETVTL